MTLQLTTRRSALLGAAALIAALYLADLSGMGLISVDEPRYADIGRAMARTGDWITPRLWGKPWFEKPPLLYWLIALGFKAGLGAELAPRLPVALLSLGFLGFLWHAVRRVWDARAAAFSVAILSTTAGWLALSHVAVTDVPMSAFFTAAVLLTMGRQTSLAAAALAFAVLAKSIPPLILFLPVLVVDYRHWRDWLRPAPILIFLGIALPWHLLMYARNGYEFVRVLFVQQQFGRFFSPERQHEQRWWFYLPDLLLLLYPWFPLLPLAARDWQDRRTKILLAVVVFGMVFFSRSLNKLPAYILPILPAVCILIGAGLARTSRYKAALALPVVLLGALPFARAVVPVAVATGLRSAPLPWSLLAWGMGAAVIVWILLIPLPRSAGFGAAFGLSGLAFLWFQIAAFPAIDQLASARPMWRDRRPPCAPGMQRGMYGLYYYADGTIPSCDTVETPQPMQQPPVQGKAQPE